MALGKRSSERALQKVLGKGANVNDANPLEVHDPKVGSLISYEGTTTADGAGDGSTLIDSVLATKPDYDGHWVVITSGPYLGQCSDITGATTGGTVTAHEAFDGQILRGTKFVILAMKALPAEVEALAAALTAHDVDIKAILNTIEGYIDTEVAAIKTQTDKLAGAAPGVGTATENWNAAEADIVSIGANDTKNKLHSLVIDISALTAAATISIRMYMQVNGVEKKVYDQDFVKDTDPDGLWIVNGTVGIHEVLRVTAQSDNAADDGKAIAYDYMLEAM